MRRRLLTIGHSYCVALNRRLAHEMARAGGDAWQVTAVAPDLFSGDLRRIRCEQYPGECCRSEQTAVYFSTKIHCMLYGPRLRQILRGRRWDVVHCWEEPYIAAGGQIAWWSRPESILVYSTFQNLPKRYPPPFNWIERYAMRHAAGWVAFGHTAEQTLCERPPYRLLPRRVIPPGVDVERFRPDAAAGECVRKNLGWNAAGPPVVGFLGRFVPAKGLDFLIRVLDQISVGWRALFVGGGPMMQRLQQWGRPHSDRVRIVTGVAHSEVPAYLNAMDVLCAPSQTTPRWREQFGRMLVEAFACGVPVLASDSGEIPHVLADAGAIAGENDERAWIDRLSGLLENSAQRAELAERGLQRARSVYAWPHVARQHLDFFEELLSVRAGARRGEQ